VKLLMDTHVLLWAASAPERLHSSADALQAADRLISAASVWELAIKQGLGKVDLGMPVAQWIHRAATELAAQILDISAAHAAAVEQLPPVHRDPFDRLLVVQASLEGAILLTGNSALTAYGSVVRLV
jgi:PIN domain nuclease of toxin-antitoxin system